MKRPDLEAKCDRSHVTLVRTFEPAQDAVIVIAEIDGVIYTKRVYLKDMAQSRKEKAA